MNGDDIIRMVKEAEFTDMELAYFGDNLARFADLVAQHERNRTWTQAHWTEYERTIVAAEREACAEIVERNADACVQSSIAEMVLRSNAAAIRARGQA